VYNFGLEQPYSLPECGSLQHDAIDHPYHEVSGEWQQRVYMVCTGCTKAYELIALPVGSSKDAVKSARKEWSKNLHPDIWQNRPGWKGAANQLTNINVAIDHLLQCDGAGSYSYASSGATPKSVSEAEVPQAIRQANEALALEAWTKGWIMFAGFCVLFVLPLFYLTTTLSSSGQVDASNQETTSFTPQPSGIPQSDATGSSPTQAVPVVEDRAAVEAVEQPEGVPVTSSPTPLSPEVPAAPASITTQTAIPDEAQLKVEAVPVTVKVMDDPVVSHVAPAIRNQYGFAHGTAPVGYAAMQEPEAQATSRAITLILSNGPTIYVTNVWYSREQIMFTMPNGSHRTLGLEQVNFRSTIQANHEIGVDFNTPPGYPGN
jgi:hypothetical protein